MQSLFLLVMLLFLEMMGVIRPGPYVLEVHCRKALKQHPLRKF